MINWFAPNPLLYQRREVRIRNKTEEWMP